MHLVTCNGCGWEDDEGYLDWPPYRDGTFGTAARCPSCGGQEIEDADDEDDDESEYGKRRDWPRRRSLSRPQPQPGGRNMIGVVVMMAAMFLGGFALAWGVRGRQLADAVEILDAERDNVEWLERVHTELSAEIDALNTAAAARELERDAK